MNAIPRMIVIIAATLAVMKCMVLALAGVRLAPARMAAFFLWPGMRPGTFAARRFPGGVWPRVLRGVAYLAAGAMLFLLARAIAPRSLAIAIVIALPALSLMLHFGVFSLATAAWRAAGFAAEDLFRKPWSARSLEEFWSRRWNAGFSDMLGVTVFRPVCARLGRTTAVLASFLASGLLHELAISVPARGGYGLPTLYFLLHGGLVAAGVRGRVAMFLALLVPLPLCFHAPFLRAVILPMLV
jgi:alginate O-acetyltransferase complex protein AlgI